MISFNLMGVMTAPESTDKSVAPCHPHCVPTLTRKEKMDLQTQIDALLAHSRKETLASSKQLTLGEVLLKINAISANDDCGVVFDGHNGVPTGIDSWRGSYDELALSYDNQDPMKVCDFREMLTNAIGKVYEGYKGGEYKMSRHTPIWVDNWSMCRDLGVVDVFVDGDSIALKVEVCEF